jgi:hypothetical protein
MAARSKFDMLSIYLERVEEQCYTKAPTRGYTYGDMSRDKQYF